MKRLHKATEMADPKGETGRPIAITMQVTKIQETEDGSYIVVCESPTMNHELKLSMDSFVPEEGDWVTVSLKWRKIRFDKGVRFTDPTTWKKDPHAH